MIIKNIFSSWIPGDQKFISDHLMINNNWRYSGGDLSSCVLYNERAAWVNSKDFYLNSHSIVTNGLLVGSCWPTTNWNQPDSESLEHIGYVDLDSYSRDFVVLHTISGNYTSCAVVNKPDNIVKFMWTERMLRDLFLNTSTRTLIKGTK